MQGLPDTGGPAVGDPPFPSKWGQGVLPPASCGMDELPFHDTDEQPSNDTDELPFHDTDELPFPTGML